MAFCFGKKSGAVEAKLFSLEVLWQQGEASGVRWQGLGEGKKSTNNLPGPPKVCFLEVFCYIKPTKKHSFGGLGT